MAIRTRRSLRAERMDVLGWGVRRRLFDGGREITVWIPQKFVIVL